MRKNFILFLSLITFIILSNNSFAQVSVGGTPYTTLKEAFDAINVGTHTGAVTIALTGNTTETATAVLDSSGNGTGSNYTAVVIQPSGGATRTVSGAIVGHLVVLNGADNVTIDGLNAGGNAIEFRNSGIGASSTIRFLADATNNTVTNCTITGSTTSFGVVFFSTGSVNGNDGNTVSNNNITVEGVNFPTAGIYSLGTSSVIDNSANIISGNNISNYFSASAVSNGMNLTTGSSGWTISNNKFFQTASRTYTTANTHNGITASVGTGYTVTGNTIGYATSGGTGTYTMLGTIATRFIAINLSTTAGVTSTVQGNTVAAISLNTSSGATTTNGIICGINVTGTGSVNIGNVTPNTIGATSGINSIVGTATTSGGLVVGINSSATGTVLIQNNTFGAMTSSGITATIAGSVCGINVSGVTASMTITGNTIGNGTTDNMRGGTTALTTGSSLVTGIAIVSIPTLCNVTNNTIQNLTSYGTGATGRAAGIFNSGTPAAATVLNITGNTIFNILSNCANPTFSNGQTGVQGIMHSSGTGGVVSGNTIYNLSNTNTGTGGYSVSGIGIGNGLGTKVEKNIIYGLSNASTSTTVTTPGVAAGIMVRSGTTSDTIVNNMITLGAGQTTNTSFIGIMLNHGSTPDPVSNIFYNTVSISGTVTSGAQPSFGLARTDFSVTARLAGVNAKNNIFDNSRTGGTGKHYAIANNYGVVTSSATGWGAGVTDYNVLNSASASTVGFWTTDQTLAGWRTASSCDLVSITAIPITYTNSATGNLRLNMGVTATQLESGATTISTVTTDIDGFARPKPGAVNGGGFAPDYGASEADMVPSDASGPVITYTNIANTTSTSNYALSGFAVITDLTGVNTTAGTNPRIYYKRTTDANAFVGNTSGDNGWKYVEASNAVSPFSFTIDFSILLGGSVSTGTSIQYFVVAQDIVMPTPYVSSNPTIGFVGTTVAAITSAPTTPNVFYVGFPLSGDYTVGLALFRAVTGKNIQMEARTRKVMREVDASTVGNSVLRENPKNPSTNSTEYLGSDSKTFVTQEVEEVYYAPTINGVDYKGELYHQFTKEEKRSLNLSDNMIGIYTTIAAAIADASFRGLSGATQFLLTDASYSETYPLTIGSIAGASSTNKLTIKPQVGNTNCTITGTSTSAGFVLNGSDYIVIDGSNDGTTSRDLTIINTNAGTASAVVWMQTTASLDAATNNTVKNCVITGNSNTTTLFGVGIGSNVVGITIGLNNNNNTISNNNISKVQRGVFIQGTSTSRDLGNVISNNLLNAAAPNNVAMSGILISNQDGCSITGNTIDNIIQSTGTTDGFGITCGSIAISTGVFTGTSNPNTTISGNIIGAVQHTNTYSACGIYYAGAASGTTNIVNNSIYGVGGNPTSGDFTSGILVSNVTGSTTNIYYNSVSMTGTFTGGTDRIYGIAIGTGDFPVNVKNNVVLNTQVNGTGVSSGIVAGYATFANLASDYNNISGAVNFGGTGSMSAPTAQITLADWRTATGKDASSISGNPGFTSLTNLAIDPTSSNAWNVNGLGTQIASVTTDILGAARSTTVAGGGTDLGAYNVTPVSTPPTATASGAPANSTTTTYSLNGKLLCSITWGAGGTVPSGVTFTYYPGVNPPGSAGYQVGNGYWVVTVPDGSGFSYDITFNYDDALLGAISPETDLRLSKSEDGGVTWNSYLTAGTGVGEYELNTTNNTIKVYGLTAFSTFGVSDNDAPLPVELSSFTSLIDKRNVTLKWSTVSEENNSGFDIERRVSGSANSWSKVGNVAGAGTSTTAKNYSFTENNLNTGKYNYRLKQIDFNGNFKYYDLSNEVIIGVPSKFDISQNYPNPFNPSTKINFDLPFDSKVQIKVFDITGREMTQILNETKTAGYHTVQFNALNLASGVYFYMINANGGNQSYVKTMKMVLVK